MAYRTYGTLNAERSNAVLVCHALTGDQYAAERHPITGKPGWWDTVVGPGRRVLDLAVDSRERTVRRFIHRADDDKTFDLRAMEDLLARTKGHRGQAKVRAALEIYDETPVFTRSDLEKRFEDSHD